MTKRGLLATALSVAAAASCLAQGEVMMVAESRHGVGETAERAMAAIEARGLKLVARIDHTAGARAAGLELRPTELLLFGNPKVGAPLMHCRPTVAIELPQKLLIWEDLNGVTGVGCNAPACIDARHDLAGCAKVLEKVGAALSGTEAAATE